MFIAAGCGGTSVRQQPTPPQQPTSGKVIAPTATVTPTALAGSNTTLPAFSDWRAAYLAADGRLHAVALDGAQDVSGPPLPGMDSYALNFASAGISPNGRLLAYVANAGLSIVDVSGNGAVRDDPSVAAIYQMYWSPDGSELALCDGEGSLWVAKPSSVSAQQHPKAVPGTPGRSIGILLGWIDATHVAVTMAPTADSIALGALDVTSGGLRRVATIKSSNLSTYHFSLSPDGAHALFFNQRYRDQPYTQLADLITIATGAVTPLPHLAQIMGPYSGFSSLAWRDGSIVAASTGFKENGDLKGWLLDVHTDSASPLPNGYYPLGWAPAGKTLVGSTAEQLTVGWGPYEIAAVTVDASGHYTSTTLTRNVYSFPFVGFVRTA